MTRRFTIIADTSDTLLEKRGVKRKASKNNRINFIGKKAKSFTALTESHLLTPDEEASIGAAYNNAIYEKNSSSKQREYELVYGKVDYTQAVAEDSSVKAQLDKLFGSSPLLASGVLEETQLKTVLGATRASLNSASATDMTIASVRAQNNLGVVSDDESNSIRGVGADDALVETFV